MNSITLLHFFNMNYVDCTVCEFSGSTKYPDDICQNFQYAVMAKNICTLGKYDQRRLWKCSCIVNHFDLLFKKNHTNLTLGSSNLILEGRCPAEFSSNPHQTHLKQLFFKPSQITCGDVGAVWQFIFKGFLTQRLLYYSAILQLCSVESL